MIRQTMENDLATVCLLSLNESSDIMIELEGVTSWRVHQIHERVDRFLCQPKLGTLEHFMYVARAA
jgi:hypothetical protein